MRNAECGMEKNGEVGMEKNAEWKSRTRRRPIGRDYAAAKDAKAGIQSIQTLTEDLDSGLSGLSGLGY